MTPAQLIAKGFRWKCPELCGIFKASQVANGLCPKCGAELVDLSTGLPSEEAKKQRIQEVVLNINTSQFPPCTKELPEHGKFLKWLRERELPFVHANPCKKGTTNPGVLDFIVGISWQVIWLEFKTDKGKLTAEQEIFCIKLRREKLTPHVVRSFEEAVHVVETLSRSISCPYRKL